MSGFVKHEPCPECGSRDNLARYKDGSAYCFGCGHYEPRTTLVTEEEKTNERVKTVQDLISIYERGSTELGEEAINWFHKYGLTVEDIIRNGIRWNAQNRQILFPIYDEFDQLCCIQARNFDPERKSKAKYYNIGNKNLSLTIYKTEVFWRDLIVLTEDIVSSLKIARLADAMPLLGTSIQKDKLLDLWIHYEDLLVWLDRDKWKEAQDIAFAAKLLGFNAKVAFSDKDPKEYSTEEIRVFLEEAFKDAK